MKKLLIVALALSMVIGLTSLAMAAGTGISGSAHDFSNRGWTGTMNDQICAYCHSPHDKGSSDHVTNGPLWNHALDTTTTFTVYTSATMNETPGQPDGISKACLGCHDGVVAVDSFGGATGTHTVQTINANKRVPNLNSGTNLKGTHPISMLYNDDPGAGGDAELVALTDNVQLGNSGTVAANLDAGKVQCSSCHDVHNSPIETLGDMMLRVDNAGSALCLKCHAK